MRTLRRARGDRGLRRHPQGGGGRVARAIARLPEGESSAEGLLDSDGVVVDQPVKLAVTITIKDGIARFDFSSSDPQARGPVNLRPSMVEACVFYSLIGCLGPDLHFNDGMRDVVRLAFAPRTVTNAEPPAPVSNYQMVNLKLVDVILEALAHFHPAPRHRQCRLVECAHHRLGQGPARTIEHAIRDHGFGLWRRHGP